MKIGIVGGGQLARLLILAAYEIGYDCAVYVTQNAPAVQNIVPIYQGDSYEDNPELSKFLNSVDVITYESENIPVSFLKSISNYAPVLPNIAALSVTQDRLKEKKYFQSLEIPTNRFIEVNCYQDLQAAADKLGYPFILKTRQNGYDGKGQHIISGHMDLTYFKDLKTLHFIAEEWINYSREVSLIGVRDRQGNLAFYDLCQNNHKKGILQSTHTISNDHSFDTAKSYLTRLMNALDYVGVMTIEFFDQEGRLLANEAAPRVHNSGHWTLKGASTSQFENHIRAICNLPIGTTTTTTECCLYNIIGKNIQPARALNINGSYYYHYKKTEKENRKLGHILLLKDGEYKKNQNLIQKIIG